MSLRVRKFLNKQLRNQRKTEENTNKMNNYYSLLSRILYRLASFAYTNILHSINQLQAYGTNANHVCPTFDLTQTSILHLI